MNNHEPPTHLVSHLIRCSVKATSSCSSTCIYNWESRSLEPSYSVILHRERVNKIFRKQSSRLLECLFKFFITARLPFHRTHVDGHHLQRELRQANRHRQGTISHIRFLQSNHVLLIGYVNLRRC
jgi:hypothetical protein